MTASEVIGMVLLIAGFVLIGIEMAIPGFGLPGTGGIVSLAVGILLTAKTLETGIIMVVVIIVLSAIMMTVIMTLLSSKKAKAPIVLKDDVRGEQEFLNTSDMEYLIGKTGVAATDLRPGGKGNFDGIYFDVLSDGMYVNKGERIRIIKVKDNKLIVMEEMRELEALKNE